MLEWDERVLYFFENADKYFVTEIQEGYRVAAGLALCHFEGLEYTYDEVDKSNIVSESLKLCS